MAFLLALPGGAVIVPYFGTVWNAGNVTNVTAIKKSDNSDAIKRAKNADYADAIKRDGQTKVVCFSMRVEVRQETARRRGGNRPNCRDVLADDKLPVRQGNGRKTGGIAKAVSVGRNQSTSGHKQRKCNKCNTDKKDQRPRVKVSTIYSLSATSTQTE